MSIILSMLLTSSILFLLFLLVDRLDRNLFTQKWRYFILKMVLLFYIIPFGYIRVFLQKKFSTIVIRSEKRYIFIGGKKPYIIINDSGKYFYNTAFKIEIIVFIIWICFALFIFIYYLLKFRKVKGYVSCIATKVTSSEILNVRDYYLKKLHIKQKVYIYETDKKISSFTVGIFHPIVVISKIQDAFELDATIYHELCHIKQKDEALLFFRLFVTAIYWFNPLNLLLNSYLDKVCELACDELVIKEFDREKRKRYAAFIVERAEDSGDIKQKTFLSFNNNRKIILERIQFIMKTKKSKPYLAGCIFLVLIFCSMIPAFAYEPVQTLTGKGVYGPITNGYIEFKSSNFDSDTFTVENEIKILYKKQFTDLDGNIYNVDKTENRANCAHSFLSGTFTEHQENGSGGCILISYNSRMCKKCNYIEIGSVISESKYAICPH